MKRKSMAAGLALFLGGLGIHKFYLGKPGTGLIYALFFWTFIPAILGLIEAISYISMSQAQFDAKYNPNAFTAVANQPSTLKQKEDGTTVALCPACFEEIQPEALKCKHCSTNIAPRGSQTTATALPAKKPASVLQVVIVFVVLGLVAYGMVSMFATV